MSDLIDTTEMFLRTIFELEEERTVPLRARIAERLHQSGPTVSQTVARMARDGLLTVEGDRHLELTDTGRRLAVAVMRKHRLAERLLVDVIGLPWEEVHVEACRWEHVMSEQVERRLVTLLGRPTICPHGNPIPGLAELDSSEPAGQAVPAEEPVSEPLESLEEAALRTATVTIRRISEQLQSDVELMTQLKVAGVYPEAEVKTQLDDNHVVLIREGNRTVLPRPVAALLFVAPD